MTVLYAQLQFNLCHGGRTELVVYKRKKDIGDDQMALMHFALDNVQLTELVVVQRIKPVDMNT